MNSVKKEFYMQSVPFREVHTLIFSIEWKPTESGSLNFMMIFMVGQYSGVSRMYARQGSGHNDF